MTALRTENLKIGYSGYVIAENLDLRLPVGQVTALIGENGAGKSTLIKSISGSLKLLSGEVYVNEKKLSLMSKKQISKEIAVVTTDPDMAGGLKVHELVGLGRIPYTGTFGFMSEIDREVIENTLKNVGILHKKYNFVGELSDGERQKAMIARGLAQETPILIMDEPFSFLDVASRLEIMLLLKEIASKENKVILFSTHEVTQALRMVDNLWLFHSSGKSKMIDEGTPDQLIKRGLLNRLFKNDKIVFDPSIRDFIVKNT